MLPCRTVPCCMPEYGMAAAVMINFIKRASRPTKLHVIEIIFYLYLEKWKNKRKMRKFVNKKTKTKSNNNLNGPIKKANKIKLKKKKIKTKKKAFQNIH